MKTLLVRTDTYTMPENPAVAIPIDPDYLRMLLNLMDETVTLYEKYGSKFYVGLEIADHNVSLCSDAIEEIPAVREWLQDSERPAVLVIDDNIPGECIVPVDAPMASISAYDVYWRFHFDWDVYIDSYPLEREEIEKVLAA